MKKGLLRIYGSPLAVIGAMLCLVPPAPARAQRGAQAGAEGAAPSAQQGAQIDLTGYWVSIVTEDWRWRMVTPPKGDYASIPLNAAAREVADGWDIATDVANGNECRAFGVGGIMRMPGRVHVLWEGENTLRIDTDAGTQTRLLPFDNTPPPTEPTWQGHSVAQWETIGGGRGQPPTGGNLKVVTTGMKMGYLRWNGVPYSEEAVITEYFDRHSAFGQEWFTVTTIVEDPMYLNQPFITSSHFRKLPDTENGWNPTPCSVI